MERRRPGRPRKGEGVDLPYKEIDRLLVEGELVPVEGCNAKITRYPTYRDVAERYGVAQSLIADYARTRNVMRRRKQVEAQAEARAMERLLAERSDVLSMDKEEQLRLVDQALRHLKKNLEEGRFRCDTVADLNQLLRLRSFINGGADSRQEVHASLSLEALQHRYHLSMKLAAEVTPEERGELPSARAGRTMDAPEALTPATEPQAAELIGRACSVCQQDACRCTRDPGEGETLH
jgi:hypothetical protein